MRVAAVAWSVFLEENRRYEEDGWEGRIVYFSANLLIIFIVGKPGHLESVRVGILQLFTKMRIDH